MDILEDIFGFKRKDFHPLTNKSITSETAMQINQLIETEKEIYEIIEFPDEKVILYSFNDEDNYFLHFGLRIITEKGIRVPDPKLLATNDMGLINLCDITISEAHVNNNYGTILLKELQKFAIKRNAKSITGWLSRADIDHLDRLSRFYSKNGFTLEINTESKGVSIGVIEWKVNSN